jgi:hypothetical protein
MPPPATNGFFPVQAGTAHFGLAQPTASQQAPLNDVEGGLGPVRNRRAPANPASHGARERVQAIPGHARKRAAGRKTKAKQAAADGSGPPAAGGVGPSGPEIGPTYAYKSVVDSPESSKGQDATDVWWFVRAIGACSDRPHHPLETEAHGARSTHRPPDKDESGNKKQSFVTCRYCV